MTHREAARVGARARLGISGIGQRQRIFLPPKAERKGERNGGGEEPKNVVPTTRGQPGGGVCLALAGDRNFFTSERNPNVILPCGCRAMLEPTRLQVELGVPTGSWGVQDSLG